MGYLPQAAKGIGWAGALRIVIRAITFLRIIILARFFLTPKEFGIFGIASLFSSFLDVTTETGISVFLIQEKGKLEEYINAAWIVSIVRGTVLALAIVLFSRVIANFYNSPEVFPLLLVLALAQFIEGFINPAEVKFQKDLTFHKEFYLRLFIYLTESIAVIIAAAYLRNAYAFVIAILISTSIEAVLSFIFISPKPRLIIEWAKIRTIFNRGKWVTMYSIFGYIAQEGDNFVVGKVLGPSPLAIYQTAYKFSTLPVSEVTDVVSKVVFPVYAKFQEDRPRLKRAFFQTTSLILAGSLLLGVLITVFGKDIIAFTLGEKWMGIVPLLPILAAYGILRAIFGSASAIFLAAGKQNYVAGMTFIRVLGLLGTVIPLTMMYGLIGTSFAALISVLLEIPLILYFLYNLLEKKQ